MRLIDRVRMLKAMGPDVHPFELRRAREDEGSCMRCRRYTSGGRPINRGEVYRFSLGGFIARLCGPCLSDLFQENIDTN